MSILVGVALSCTLVVALGVIILPSSSAQEIAGVGAVDSSIVPWALMSAALVAGLSALAAGYAVAQVGSAAIGAIAEKPELLGRVLILVGLAEGIAIYGLIVAILIFNQLG